MKQMRKGAIWMPAVAIAPAWPAASTGPGRWREILATHQAPPLPDDVVRHLDEIMVAAAASLSRTIRETLKLRVRKTLQTPMKGADLMPAKRLLLQYLSDEDLASIEETSFQLLNEVGISLQQWRHRDAARPRLPG